MFDRGRYEVKFWSRVDKTGSCWVWTAALQNQGYGVLRVRDGSARGKLLYAHRISYEMAKGPIPEGLHLDHLCRNRKCVNPEHLEAVTPQVNVNRGLAGKKTHCLKGHLLEGANVYIRPDTGKRQCLVCKHAYWEYWYAKKKQTTDTPRPQG